MQVGPHLVGLPELNRAQEMAQVFLEHPFARISPAKSRQPGYAPAAPGTRKRRMALALRDPTGYALAQAEWASATGRLPG